MKNTLNILYGVGNPDFVRNINKFFEKQGFNVESASKYSKKSIMEYLKANPNCNVVVLIEGLQKNSLYTAEELTMLTDDRDVHVVVVLEASHRGTDYMKKLYAAGITSAIFLDGAETDISTVSDLVLHKRSRKAARVYYDIDAEPFQTDTVTPEQMNNYIAYLREDDGITVQDKYEYIVNELTIEQNRVFLERLPAELQSECMKSRVAGYFVKKGAKKSGKKSKPVKELTDEELTKLLVNTSFFGGMKKKKIAREELGFKPANVKAPGILLSVESFSQTSDIKDEDKLQEDLTSNTNETVDVKSDTGLQGEAEALPVDTHVTDMTFNEKHDNKPDITNQAVEASVSKAEMPVCDTKKQNKKEVTILDISPEDLQAPVVSEETTSPILEEDINLNRSSGTETGDSASIKDSQNTKDVPVNDIESNLKALEKDTKNTEEHIQNAKTVEAAAEDDGFDFMSYTVGVDTVLYGEENSIEDTNNNDIPVDMESFNDDVSERYEAEETEPVYRSTYDFNKYVVRDQEVGSKKKKKKRKNKATQSVENTDDIMTPDEMDIPDGVQEFDSGSFAVIGKNDELSEGSEDKVSIEDITDDNVDEPDIVKSECTEPEDVQESVNSINDNEKEQIKGEIKELKETLEDIKSGIAFSVRSAIEGVLTENNFIPKQTEDDAESSEKEKKPIIIVDEAHEYLDEPKSVTVENPPVGFSDVMKSVLPTEEIHDDSSNGKTLDTVSETIEHDVSDVSSDDVDMTTEKSIEVIEESTERDYEHESSTVGNEITTMEATDDLSDNVYEDTIESGIFRNETEDIATELSGEHNEDVDLISDTVSGDKTVKSESIQSDTEAVESEHVTENIEEICEPAANLSITDFEDGGISSEREEPENSSKVINDIEQADTDELQTDSEDDIKSASMTENDENFDKSMDEISDTESENDAINNDIEVIQENDADISDMETDLEKSEDKTGISKEMEISEDDLIQTNNANVSDGTGIQTSDSSVSAVQPSDSDESTVEDITSELNKILSNGMIISDEDSNDDNVAFISSEEHAQREYEDHREVARAKAESIRLDNEQKKLEVKNAKLLQQEEAKTIKLKAAADRKKLAEESGLATTRRFVMKKAVVAGSLFIVFIVAAVVIVILVIGSSNSSDKNGNQPVIRRVVYNDESTEEETTEAEKEKTSAEKTTPKETTSVIETSESVTTTMPSQTVKTENETTKVAVPPQTQLQQELQTPAPTQPQTPAQTQPQTPAPTQPQTPAPTQPQTTQNMDPYGLASYVGRSMSGSNLVSLIKSNESSQVTFVVNDGEDEVTYCNSYDGSWHSASGDIGFIDTSANYTVRYSYTDGSGACIGLNFMRN